jgi:hypothetical protein
MHVLRDKQMLGLGLVRRPDISSPFGGPHWPKRNLCKGLYYISLYVYDLLDDRLQLVGVEWTPRG